MSKTRSIFCCGCQVDVQVRLTDGKEIYPHRGDLAQHPFWKCDACGNFVGCHHKTKDRTNPLGCIPTREIKEARQHIHRILDPLWKSGRYGRRELYTMIAHVLGIEEYHTAEIRSVDEARRVYRIINDIGRVA
ncbi:zinc-finger-containing protein [Rhizobium sp. CNPSo 4062]|uniref:zinc-finger-containing protein n=1 Tax=Rhizobium sp. CNPSo 4062 TaxID=3021410 RepID=UPI0025510106|nr:zinc-finger-containing protein [Rhizobium sp. CNPSo 4062]MDK4703862.1 zinc-finger-containing protein [Rhizobium sp. CNPSo 4062]